MIAVASAIAVLSLLPGWQSKSPDECYVLPLPSAKEIEAQLSRREKVLAKADHITFLFRAKGSQAMLTGALHNKLEQVPGTDGLWALNLHVPRAEEVVLSYGFQVSTPEGPRESPQYVYRGPKAEPAPEVAKPLKGKIERFELNSKALGEKRPLSVYMPPASLLKPGKRIFALYASDGATRIFAEVAEPLMLKGKLPPIAIVGIPSKGYSVPGSQPYDEKQDYRVREYIRQKDPKRFDQHLKFFSEEVVSWAEKKYAIGGDRKNRGVIGFSNGGCFAGSAGLRKGDVFGLAVPLSMGIVPELTKPKIFPKFYLSAGSLEPGFLKGTTIFAQQLTAWKATFKFDKRVAGHDMEVWKSEGVKALQWYLNKS